MKLRNNKVGRPVVPLSRITAIAFVALGPVWPAIQAQTPQKRDTPERTVVVEQQYSPEIQDAQKVNILPEVEPPLATRKDTEYEMNVSLVKPSSAGFLSVFSGKEEREKMPCGYLRLGYGNYGNLDVKGNYLFNLSPRDKLNLSLATDGMEGTLKLPQSNASWKSRYYQTRAGMDYEHFYNQTRLDAGLHAGKSDFNLLPGSYTKEQQFVSGDVHLGIQSIDETLPVKFQAETNYLYYARKHDVAAASGNNEERIIRTKANVIGAITDEQSVGVAGSMNNIIYSDDNFENNTAITLTPYYEWTEGGWKLHAGANVDLAFGYGKKLQVSPDVNLQYTVKTGYVLYAKAVGGRRIRDFRQLEIASPYGELMPEGVNEDIYEQVNVGGGFKASPLSNLWFDIHGGYQCVQNDLYYYWDTKLEETGETSIHHYQQTHTNNTYLGGQINYSWKNLLHLSAKGIYYKWTADKEEALYFKPLYALDFLADMDPLPKLKLYLGYQYTAREKVSARGVQAINNLSMGASYRIYKGLSGYVRGANLLNKQYQYYHLYPTEGINVIGGVSLVF